MLRYAAECDRQGTAAERRQPKPPVAVNGKAATGKNAPVTVSVLAGDTDPSGLPLTIASVGTSGTKGLVTVNSRRTAVTYNPDGRFAGLKAGQTATDKFTYKATDGRQTSNSATVTVTITGSAGPAPQPPAVTAHSYNAVGDTPLGVGTAPAAPAATASGSVLTGDTDADPSATLSVTANTAPAHGTVTVNPDGAFTYLPNAGYSGADSFQVTVAGSTAPSLTSAETVTVNVGPVVWYVNDSRTAPGNGTAATPFNTLAAADSAAGPDSIVFLYQGSAPYTGGAVMQPGEDLWGQPHGLTVGGYALVAPGGSAPVITNSGGDGIDLADGADVEGVSVTGAATNGIAAQTVTDATVGASAPVSVSGAGENGVDLADGDGNMNFGGTSVTGSAGYAVLVGARSGGTVTFGGPITGNGGGPYAGVRLFGNAGATIAFTGKLTLTAFQAGGTDPAAEGGTVTATGAGSTINGELAVQDTTIGAAGLRFQSISSPADDFITSIDLDSTGSAGSLTVTGTGAPGSGGTINGIPGNDGAGNIGLSQTYAPSFTDMVIENVSGGIDGDQVDGLTLAGSTLSDTPLNLGSGEAGLTGTASITGSAFNGKGAVISDDSGALNLTAAGNTFSGAGGGLTVDADGGATVCAAITGNSGAGGISLTQSTTSTIELPGYTGGPEDTIAVESFLEARNSMPATATASGSGGGFTGGSGC